MTKNLLWLQRPALALLLMAAVPAAFAQDFRARLEQLLATQPLPLFVVLKTDGMIEVPLDVQRMADEMPARIKKADASALWFDVLVLVVSPVTPASAKVVFEFKTRCAVTAAAGYAQQGESQNAMLSGMSTLVKLAQDRGMDPRWGGMCVPANESVEAGYRQVMQFPPNGMQVMATSRLVYLTSVNSSLLFAF